MSVLALPTSTAPAAGVTPLLIEAAEAIAPGRAIRKNSAGKAVKASSADVSRGDVIGITTAEVYAAGQFVPYVKPGDKLVITGATKGVTYYLDPGTNEVQTITITGSPTGGTFTLTYGGKTTAAIAYNANAAAVQSALEALSSIGSGNVVCGGGALPDSGVTVTFKNTLGGQDVALITHTDSLTGGTSPAVSVAETTPGVTSGKLCVFADLVTGNGIVVVAFATASTELIVDPRNLKTTV